jgi:O-antigen/teichoic acid export membrane protein
MYRIKKVLRDKDFIELFKEGGISFFYRFGGLILGYILTLIIANLFGARGLGDYVLAITVLRLFTLFSKLGFDTTSIRFLATFSDQKKWSSIYHFRKQIIFILLFTSIFSSLAMYFFALPISELINANHRYIQLNSFFVLPLTFFILHYQSLRGIKRIADFSFFYRVSQVLFSIIFIIVLYQFTISKDVPIYAYLLSVFVVFILSIISFRYWLKKKSLGIESAELEIIGYRKLFSISIPLMFAQSVQFIMAWTDKLMLGAMTTSSDVGVYHTAFKLSMFASIILMSINSIAAPKFAESYAKNDIIGLKKIAQQSTKMIFWGTLPLLIVFFLFPGFLLGLFGEEFKIAVITFLIISCGRLVSSFSGPVGNILQMTGMQSIYAKILFFGSVFNIILNLWLIPIYGINGAAIASMISVIIWNISMVLVVKNKFGFYTFYIPFTSDKR